MNHTTIFRVLSLIGGGVALASTYGYYTFEVRQADQIIGMVSVNGITGEVWYHNPYGLYVDRLIVTP